MTSFLLHQPKWLHANLLAGMRRGIEKEGLRMAQNGFSAKTFHPKALGSKLTHPYITTDYSENLLELITPPFDSIDKARQMLTKLHILVHESLEEGEIMWPLSMPCMLSSKDEDIPLADYGVSNIGQLKTLYRSGLGVRYGRKMQTIAGLHYNLSIGDELFETWYRQDNEGFESLSDFKNAKYLGLIRNFKRLSPLVLYLTGASPSVCACFIKGREHDLIPLNDQKNTYYTPFATSLRMGKLGYTNSVQKDLRIRYNELNDYIKLLRQAIYTPFEAFSQIGIDDKDGNPIQINDHILQIENEFYSPIRPKQITQSGETPTHALGERGIAYVEFRAIDLNPYSPIGIGKKTAGFLESLALYCLFSQSPKLFDEEEALIAQNIEMMVNEGRKQGVGIQLWQDGQISDVAFNEWAMAHLSAIEPLAQLLDDCHDTNDYTDAITFMQTLIKDSTLTLSARMVADSLKIGSVWGLGDKLGREHQQQLLAQKLSDDDKAYFENLAQVSWQEQYELEKSDTVSFKEFLLPYRTFD